MPQTGDTILSPEELVKLNDYELLARLAVEGFLSGLHRSVAHGHGGEFVQYRSYVPGDDLKHVDWKLFARSNRVCTREFLQETEMRCVFLLDASASMGYQGTHAPCSKFHYGAMVAACFTYLARRQGDCPGLVVFNNATLSASRRGEPHLTLPELQQRLADIVPSATANLLAALPDATQFLGRARGLVVLLSDLWDNPDALRAVIRQLRFANRDIIVIHILDDDEANLPLHGPHHFVDSESPDELTTDPDSFREAYLAKMRDHLEHCRQICLDNEADYLLVNTAQPLVPCLAAWLQHREGLA
ncbi:MAG: DUF58 domain-containing protein [Victivallales bacterium]|nr:DUF58 domain-containing protein [Victivallales bacterium]